MLKKLSVGVVSAGALSLCLAAAAWADPGNGNGNGAGGIPGKIGTQLNAPGPVTPGSVVSVLAKEPGTNTPTAVGAYESENFGAPNVPTPPGQVVRIFTPGCKAGGSLPCL
jgi:hypothetical protein